MDIAEAMRAGRIRSASQEPLRLSATDKSKMPPEPAQTIRRTFTPVGECIYCGSKDQLTNEHIIPYSLNGIAVLPLASCQKHATATSKFELSFARGPAWPMRAAFGFQSYGKKYPQSFPLIMHKNGKKQSIEVPLAEFPIILQMPMFAALPAFLLGQRGVPISSAGTVAVSLRPGKSPTDLLQEIGHRYGGEGIEVPRVSHKAFARLLAKSAYALAVAECGLANIRSKYVVPAILDEADDLGTWIGSSPPLAAEQAGHTTQVQTRTGPTGESIIAVLMKFFANLPTPAYVVIVASKV
jgi:hypothetical protein